ncbi:MAG TPA: excinuclease ABC subunit UvrB [Bdellovibrionota bacterium]|nr:excinuclease ABC subunit UvrB [Bdellovibrionota bacterium]
MTPKKLNNGNSPFRLTTDFVPKGDQPEAIDSLVAGLGENKPYQVLLGVTGSGKTFTVANMIAQTGKPALIIAPNKTLAAQLYNEFRNFFPENAVEYFVSYYDYYQPEAYVPTTDTYIEKDARINDEIDKMRHSATRSVLTRPDTIVVASVSCIYNLGSPEEYKAQLVSMNVGEEMERDALLRSLVDVQYQRNDYEFTRSTFRVRGDVVEIFPSHEEKRALRISFFGDEIEKIREFDPLTGQSIRELPSAAVYPGTHYVTPKDKLRRAIQSIQDELRGRLQELRSLNKLLEAQRLEQRTLFDIEMMEEMGFCSGIENYTRHLTGAAAGERPPTLLDYFPKDFVCVIDESHVTIPQIGGMFRGDRSRKSTLVEYGFRLPSALDNRPMTFEEFEAFPKRTVFVSATPGPYELKSTKGEVIEQIIRPTGLTDPELEVRPATQQVDDLLGEIRKRVERNERVLVTTLTKRMAEDLTDYYRELNVKVEYLHSDVDTLERVEILRDLRLGKFDVLVGINLLREGLDLPEVSLVAILDADKEGFLRSITSLIQTFGRASRNVRGRVIMYGDQVTQSMQKAIHETQRRREIQARYNQENNITPATIERIIHSPMAAVYEADYVDFAKAAEPSEEYIPLENVTSMVEKLRKEMFKAAQNLEFEQAAELRDKILRLQKRSVMTG